MIAAGHVVEFMAKVAVAVVEVDVEEQFGESDGQHDQHSTPNERVVVCGWVERELSWRWP